MVMHAGFAQHAIPTQFIAIGIVPAKTPVPRCNFQRFSRRAEPIEATGVSYRGTLRGAKMFPVDSLRLPASIHTGELS
jgi:hypothetical protein